MNFRILPTPLHATAEKVMQFFIEDRGISKFKIEEAVSKDVDYRPTLQALAPEYHDVWIEVTDKPYLTSLDSVVLHCVRNCLPVQLFIAYEAGISETEFRRCVDEARKNGVGVIEVSVHRCVVVHEALMLSLFGLRVEDRKQFPPRYRSVLSAAERTFKQGDPGKGCALVYDEIEALSRRLAKRVQVNGWWSSSAAGPPTLNADTDAWATLLDILITRMNLNALPGFKKHLLLRVAALTQFRNDTGHKPKNRAHRVRRDRELRTRFEFAVDVLRDLTQALKHLRL